MSETTIEARHLSGVDLGKTVTIVDGGAEQVLRGIEHREGLVVLFLGKWLSIPLAPSDAVTITGQPPATHGEGKR